MRRGIWGYSYWALAALGILTAGCESGGVGDPCIPEAEYDLYFNNFGEADVFAETRSFQCETRLCLVNHFRGRVSCPYGQTKEDLEAQNALPADQRDLSKLCTVPGTSGEAPPVNDQYGNQLKVSADVIQVPVATQLISRSPDNSVYCSCRCKNDKGQTDDGANYCECPSGFSCEKLLSDPGLGKPELAGYYCIKSGSRYEPNNPLQCDRNEQNCDNRKTQ